MLYGHDEKLSCCKISQLGTKTLFVVFRTAELSRDNPFYDVPAVSAVSHRLREHVDVVCRDVL